jgi:hypothetical protein
VVECFLNVTFFVASEANEFWPPARFELEHNSRCEENRSCQLCRQVLLKGILLQESKVTEELCLLLDVLGDLLNQSPSLPTIFLEGGSFREEVSNDVQGRKGTESPSKMSQHFELTLAKREWCVTCVAKLCQIEEVGNGRTVLFSLFVLGSDTYASSRKKLPLAARDFP